MSDQAAFFREQFDKVAKFKSKSTDVDYSYIYKIIDRDSIKDFEVFKLSSTDGRIFEVISLSIRKSKSESPHINDENIVNSNSNNNSNINNNTFTPIPSRSISCDVQNKQNIFSQFLTSDMGDTAALFSLDSSFDQFKSPLRKKSKISNDNVEPAENKSENKSDDTLEIKEEVSQQVFFVQLVENTSDSMIYTSEISALWDVGNIKLAATHQLKTSGKTVGNVLLIDCLVDGKSVISEVKIPIVQHLRHKPTDAMSQISKIIAQNIGSHASLNTEYSPLMKIFFKEYLCKQITATDTSILFTISGPGGYDVVDTNSQVIRIIVHGNKNKVMKMHARQWVHPWKAYLYLDFDEDANFPKIIPNQIDAPLSNSDIDDFCIMYSVKERMTFCKCIAMNNIGLEDPQIFRDHGGINPGVFLHGDPDGGKSQFIKYVLAAVGSPTVGAFKCKNPKVIMGNYTESHIQQRADDMPGFLLIFEDADRESGNKQNIGIKKLSWICAETNSNSTITHGDRAGATGAYLLTGNLDITFVEDEGTRTRLFVDNFRAAIVDKDILIIDEMISKAEHIQHELARRTLYLLLNGEPSAKTSAYAKNMVLHLIKLMNEKNNQHLSKYFHKRTNLLHMPLLSRTIKVNSLLFAGKDRQTLVKEYMNSIMFFLKTCRQVNENPLDYGMRSSYEEYLRYFIFWIQCSKIDVKLIENLRQQTKDTNKLSSLLQIEKLAIAVDGDKSVVIKDNWIGVKYDTIKGNGDVLFEHLNNLCMLIVKYRNDYLLVGNNTDLDIQMNEQKINDIEIFKGLENCWDDVSLKFPLIMSGKFIKLTDFNKFFALSDKYGKCLKQPTYNTKRCKGNRYFTFILPDSLLTYVNKYKLKATRNNKKVPKVQANKNSNSINENNSNNNNNDKQSNNNTQSINNIVIESSLAGDMKISYIILEIEKNEAANSFKKPVDTEMYPNYCDIISDPIDLSIISSKNYNGDLNVFSSDVRKMCYNAMRFNKPESDIFKNATKILDLLYNLLAVFSGGNVGGAASVNKSDVDDIDFNTN